MARTRRIPQGVQPRPGPSHPDPPAQDRLCASTVTSRGSQRFHLTDSEIKLLAIAEHERWNRERIADGWTLADKKNVERRGTPYLLPWEQLNERYPDIAELDAVFVRAMPAILASAGLQIIRTPAESEPSP